MPRETAFAGSGTYLSDCACSPTPFSHEQRPSTSTFLLYLEACEEGGGGETLLLEHEGQTLEASGAVLAAVRPVAGRSVCICWSGKIWGNVSGLEH